MGKLTKTLAGLAACAALASGSAVQADPIVSNAENIRKLNIMLMVTSLRCRSGEHDFQAEYQRFTTTHLANLNRAGGHLRRDLQARLGAKGSKRALDRIGVGIANSYGDGHPWMDCAELKNAVTILCEESGPQHLSVAASELLAIEPGTKWAAR